MKKTAKQSASVKSRRTIVPPSLKKGDTIGLIAPAGSLISRKNFEDGIKILEKKGFRVKYNRNIIAAKGYLAGTDQERADEFNRLWSDPEVKGIVAARGGYGCMRMVDLIDMKQIRKNPKILIGFSDITVLLNAIYQKTKLVTYHGPVVTTLASIDTKSRTVFLNLLAGKTIQSGIPLKCKTLQKGALIGILLGGNLTTLVHTIGTPYEIPWHEAILFIEDTGEPPYRLDRLLTHLSQAKKLQKIRGLILGTFNDAEKKENRAMTRTVHERAAELLAGYDIPVWTDLPVGHGRRNITLPIGMQVEIDSRDNMLKFF